MYRSTLLFVVFLFANNLANAQSTVLVRNSTWQDFEVSVSQTGTLTVDPSEYTPQDPLLRSWLETTGQQLLTVNRTNAAIPNGDTAYFSINLNGITDSLTIELRVIGMASGTSLEYSVSGNGFAEPWFDDGGFHEVNTTFAGKDVVIKFKPDNDDNGQNRNIRFAIHDLPIYEIDEADLANPNVMNVMFYNIQMLPFGVSGMGQMSERAERLPAQISPYQDVVSFAEIFDDGARAVLIPAMEAVGFSYHTSILNDPGLIPFPWNGGVMIFSRWPIELEDEIDFELCGQASQDCLANKGIKYARINKLGKTYHIFGTHMDAGGGADDIEARRSQMAEMREMIADMNIPDGEAVIYGGDYNVNPIDSDNDFLAMLDSLDPVIPQHIGYYESNFSDDFGNIIDHGWGDRNHLIATESTSEVITLRSLDPVLWDISEFSDHRCSLGHFVYPDISANGGDTLICPGEDLTLSIATDHTVSYQWFKDGTPLSGETNADLNLTSALESQSGNYSCTVAYDVIYGNWPDSLNQLFYPHGIDTVEARLSYDLGEITIDEVLCHVGIEANLNRKIQVYPNPTSSLVSIPFSQHFGIIDMVGKDVTSNVKTTPRSNNRITLDLSQLPSGIYTVHTDSGMAKVIKW